MDANPLGISRTTPPAKGSTTAAPHSLLPKHAMRVPLLCNNPRGLRDALAISEARGDTRIALRHYLVLPT